MITAIACSASELHRNGEERAYSGCRYALENSTMLKQMISMIAVAVIANVTACERNNPSVDTEHGMMPRDDSSGVSVDAATGRYDARAAPGDGPSTVTVGTGETAAGGTNSSGATGRGGTAGGAGSSAGGSTSRGGSSAR